MTDVPQAMACKPQHWDWGQTEITSPVFTLLSVTDYYNKRDLTVNVCMLDVPYLKHLIKLIIIVLN